MKDGFRVIDGDAHMQEPMDIWDPKVVIADRSNLAGLDLQHRSVNQFVLTGIHLA